MADIPDYYATAIVRGLHDSELITLAVDAQGRIIMVPYGTTTIEGSATVTQAEKDREIRGFDGTTLRTLAVDSAGRMIMLAKAMHDTTLTNVLCDAAGNLQANLKVQDLSEIINRPKYGGCKQSTFSDELEPNSWTTIYNITSKGVIYGGFLATGSTINIGTNRLRITIDNTAMLLPSIAGLSTWALTHPAATLVFLVRYNATTHDHTLQFTRDITFESSYKVEYWNRTAQPCDVDSELYYALV